MSKKALNVQDDSRRKGIQGNTSKSEIKCVCLNARSIINKKTELNIMVDDIKPHIIGITESWANNDITNAELGLEGYVMFRKDRIGRRGGGVLLYIKDTIPAYEVQLQEEADCNEAIWCNLVTGHTTVIIGVVYRCPNITLWLVRFSRQHICCTDVGGDGSGGYFSAAAGRLRHIVTL